MDGAFQSPRGAAAVGQIDDLPAIEAGAVIAMRLACSPPDDPARRDFAALPGGRTAIEALEDLTRICASFGRRPLLHHALSCRCLGGDEACLAQMVAAALAGDRDDAMAFACLMARADMAPVIVAHAERAAVALARMAAAPAHYSGATRLH
ncbi:hypothetical protein [Maritimibacter sp. DP1N21-5]|uniref:hypothetical protein n=1 Tax=Maritimibacter sp. DP1N21-5 TaxID=2836867 RepID=UPI001C444E5C|nr:hypothetical protein [Maritimibacter sp. DP1N21-5]MBV7409107.1 hypothetical protein [Maritimibacter sp. DP1N21-5]